VTLTNKKGITVTVGGKLLGGITKFTARAGKETVFVPSTEVPGAYEYRKQNVHYLQIERRVFEFDDYSDLYALTNFDVVTTYGDKTIRYTGCETEDIYEYFEEDGNLKEVLKISVEKRTVVK